MCNIFENFGLSSNALTVEVGLENTLGEEEETEGHSRYKIMLPYLGCREYFL